MIAQWQEKVILMFPLGFWICFKNNKLIASMVGKTVGTQFFRLKGKDWSIIKKWSSWDGWPRDYANDSRKQTSHPQKGMVRVTRVPTPPPLGLFLSFLLEKHHLSHEFAWKTPPTRETYANTWPSGQECMVQRSYSWTAKPKTFGGSIFCGVWGWVLKEWQHHRNLDKVPFFHPILGQRDSGWKCIGTMVKIG